MAEATGGLALRLDHLPSEDRLEVELNGRALPWEQAQVSGDGWSRELAAPLFWASYPTRPVEAKNGRGQRGICSGWFFFAAGH